MSDNPENEILNTPRRYQQRVRNTSRDLHVTQEINTSPRRRRTIPSSSNDQNRFSGNEDVFANDGRAPAGFLSGSGLELPLNNGASLQWPPTPTTPPPAPSSSVPRQPLQSVNNRSVAQRRRREREAAEKARQLSHNPPLVSRRSAGQLRRQVRQAEQRQNGPALQTPPATPVAYAHSERLGRRTLSQCTPNEADRREHDIGRHNVSGLHTPPATQFTSNGSEQPNRRSLAQRARRERERRERENGLSTPILPGHVATNRPLNQNSLYSRPSTPSQIAESIPRQLFTPPATQQRPSSPSQIQAHVPLPPHQPCPPSPIRTDDGEEDRTEPIPADAGFNPDYTAFVGTTGLFCAARRPYVEPVECHDLGQMEYVCAHCGALHWLKEKNADSPVNAPEFGKCCKHGQVRLPLLQRPPGYLHRLYTADDHQAKEFRENIAQYNSALAFTSVGVSIDDTVNHRGRGPPVFRIHGELKHLSGTLLPREGQAPAYAQLYILDPRTALQYRMHRNGNLQRDTMEGLQAMLRTVNPYSQIYEHAFEILQQHPDMPDLTVRLRVMPGQDRRRYNLPTADEVAAIVPGDGTQAVDNRDIILRLRPDENGSGALQRVNDGHAAYAPLQYVLLFPWGEPGWHWSLQLYQPEKDRPKRLSQTRYAAFRLHPRQDEFSTHHTK